MLYEAADAKEIAEIITIDKSAAFDSVHPDLLLDKLRIYGLEGHSPTMDKDILTT